MKFAGHSTPYWIFSRVICLRGAEGVSGREGEEKSIFHLLVYSPNACDSWGWAWLSTQFFHMSSRKPSTWAILYSFTVTSD